MRIDGILVWIIWGKVGFGGEDGGLEIGDRESFVVVV